MSDLDEYISGQGGGEDEPKKPLSDLGHFLATIGEGALHAPSDIAGFVGDIGHDIVTIAKSGALSTDKLSLPGLGPVSSAINQAWDQRVGQNLEQEGSSIEDVKPKNDLERYLNAASRGVAAGMVGGPSAVGKAVVGGALAGVTGEGVYEATGSPTAAWFAGLAAGGAPFAMRGKSPVARGMSHPDFAKAVDEVIPRLEGGGTLENPLTNPESKAFGPMQVTPETLRDPGYGIKPWNGTVADSVRVGREKFAALLHKYDGDIEKALAAYNWGEGNVDHAVHMFGDRWIIHAPQETANYVNRGLDLLYGGHGTTGGPVPPMASEDMARAMGESEPASRASEIAPDKGEIVNEPINIGEARAKNVVEEHQALNDTLDSHLAEADNVLYDLKEGDGPGIDANEIAGYQQGAHEILDGMDESHPLYYKAKAAANVWDNIAATIGEDAVAPKPELDPFKPEGGDKVLGQEPKQVEPANDTSEADAVDREGVYGFGDEPPSGGKEPPFGGGGEGEPPSGGETPEDKYAGSINLNRMAISNAAKENIKLMAAPLNMDIETFNETRQKAQSLIDEKGVEGVLNETRVAPEDLAHYATAVRAIHAAAQEHMLALNAEFLDPARNGDVAHVRWNHAREVLATAFERNQNISKGLGRGLGALRIEVGGEGGNLGEKISEAMKSRSSDEEIARMIQEHPEQAGKIARDSMKPGASDYIFTTWYAMLLSSLKTLAKNVLSNGLHGTWESGVVYPIAAAFGKLHGGEKVTFHEVGARLSGAMQGTLEGFKNAPEAYRKGSPSDFAERTQSYWKPQNKGIGRVISAPMRILSAQDQVFLDMGQNAEYFGLAHREAFKEGLEPGTQEYADRVQHYLENPTKKMEKSAVNYGKYIRFQDPMEFKGLEYATRSTKKDPVMIKVMKGFLRVLFPFPRNSDRMFFAAVRNSPLGLIEPKNMRDFAAGGAMRDVAAARVFAGTMLAGAIYLWAANGGITGANPADPSKKFMMNFGPVHVSYQGLADPFSTAIASIATGVEDAKSDGKDLFNKIFKSVIDVTGVLLNSTWSTGASQFFAAADDGTGKTMQNWVGRMASSFTTPAAVREIAQDYVDPTVRNTKQNPIVDNVKAGIPGLSKTLPARHDAFGDKIVRENPAYLDFINPARVQIDKHPGLSADLADVESATPLLSKAPNKVTINGVKHELSAKGQEKYQAVSGRIFRQLMEGNRGQLQSLPNDEKVKLVRKTMSEARKQARQELWGS